MCQCRFYFLLFLLAQVGTHEDYNFPSNIIVGALEPPLVYNPGFLPNYFAYIQLDILHWLQGPLKFDFTITSPPDLRFGGFNNGRWDGIIGEISRKEMDLGAAGFSMTYRRYQVVDFSVPIFLDVTGIMMPFPEENSKAFAAMQTYPISVWFALFASILGVALAFWSERRLTRNKPESPPPFSSDIMYCLTILLQQGNELRDGRLSIRLVGAAWALSAVVIVGVYNGVFISLLTVPTYTPIVNSLDDVANSKDVKFVTIRSTAVDAAILAATNGTYKAIGDSFRKYPETLIDSDAQGIDMVSTGKYVYSAERKQLEFIIQEDLRKTGKCRFTLTKNNFMERKIAFALQKDSPLKQGLNQMILIMWQNGFMDFWQRRYLAVKNACEIKKGQSGKHAPLKLSQMASPFVVLAIGCCISSFVFVVEKAGHTFFKIMKRA